jgi:hypothetical protein
VHGLLLIDPNDSYSICKVLVGLIGAHIQSRNIYAAFRLATVSDQFISSSLNHASVLYAQYKFEVAILLAFTNANAATASAYLEASNLFAKLEIADETRTYQMSTANNMAALALARDNRTDLAKAIHARHPLRGLKNEILKRGEFDTLTEFYYAICDVFLAAFRVKRSI